MTSRIGKPDTAADQKLRDCLNQNSKGFVMVAGAGSGKTTSLVKALDYLAQTRGSDLRQRGQQIACITYTEIAVTEIWNDVGNAPLFHISTIHSFLWTVIRPFQNDLRNWVSERINEKIIEAQTKAANPRTRENTRQKLAHDLKRYQIQRENLINVPKFTYGKGSDYANGILGHDDILKIGPSLITSQPLLCTLIASRFPFIFVDESQDTNPSFVDALRHITNSPHKENFCLGFFGDPMQKIYTTGAGAITLNDDWNEITKPENFRCPISVLRVINQIRAEDDGLEQIRGRTIERDNIIEPVEGTARLFIMPADGKRDERLVEVRQWLSKTNNDPLWESNSENADVRVLVLVHRMAARRLGFADIYAALNDNGATSLKDGLLDGTAWVLKPFITYLLPLVLSARTGADFDVISSLRIHCPLLSKENLIAQNIAELLQQLKTNVTRLVKMFEESETTTIREVLNFVFDQKLVLLDDRYQRFLGNGSTENETDQYATVEAFLNSPASQLWGYRTYIEDQSPFATQQGIKGAEFQRVLVILDDEESEYNLFSYGKYLGITPLSEKDEENIAAGEDSVISRTRRLFYVCCSRATQDLAVVLFVPDVQKARKAVVEKGLFDQNNIHIFEN